MNIKDRIIYYMGINKIKVSDKLFLKIKYKHLMDKKLDLKNPQTFNEKLQWLKLYDRKEEYIKMVDKLAVKDYIANLIGDEYIIPTLGIYDSFDEIDFSKLPNQFVIKCTHDSGGLVICKDKKSFDKDLARKKINRSLKTNYYYSGREWPYKNIKPKIIIEQYMKDNTYNDLIDYKFMCFNGVPKYIFVYSNRFSDTGVEAAFFDTSWKELNFTRGFEKTKIKIKKPENFDKMLKFSRKIASSIPFVRVDWYEVNGKLYFGEITFFPSSGFGKFNPEEWDLKLGKMINLEKKGENHYEK